MLDSLHRERAAKPKVAGQFSPDLDLLQEVLDLALSRHIKGKDFEAPAMREELLEAAARGSLERLDPHSTFFTRQGWLLPLMPASVWVPLNWFMRPSARRAALPASPWYPLRSRPSL
jgi:hypothetical protein